MIILNIATDIIKALASIIADLNRIRNDNPQLKIPLGIVIWLIKVVRVLLMRTEASIISVHIGVPKGFRNFIYMLYGATPNSLRCYHKTGLFILFTDMYLVFFGIFVIMQKRWHGVFYVLMKIVSGLATVLWLTPTERLPFWLLGFGLIGVEMPVAIGMIYSWGYGIDWENENFYGHWEKHYQYRYATSNRQITVELSAYAYVISKILILCSYFCYDRVQSAERNKSPHTRVLGSLDLDIGYLNALIEQDTVANLRYGVLFLLALSSLGVYSIVLAGWSSNSKYAFIGALRSAAQMISYEVAISLIILPIVLMTGSLNLTEITYIQNITVWFLLPLLPLALIFLVAMLAETNRTPFDLPEAEAELVAGYNVDYSSLPFAMFFLGEYCNMILISVLFCLLFMAGGLSDWNFLLSAFVLSFKAAIIWCFFVFVRATLPRYRYEQLMGIGWKVLLPLCGGFLTAVAAILLVFDALIVTGELPITASSGCIDSIFFLKQDTFEIFLNYSCEFYLLQS